MEMKLIRETGANNPAIGYNKLPRHRPDSRIADLQGRDYDALAAMPFAAGHQHAAHRQHPQAPPLAP